MHIALPSHPYLEVLTTAAVDACTRHGWTVQVVSEIEAANLLQRKLVDVALITPLAYGSAVGAADLRIVPVTCMVMHDFTHVVGMKIRDGADEIHTMGSHTPQDFLPTVGGLLMQEKYDADPATLIDLRTGDQSVDCIIDVISDTADPFHLDLSEEWFDTAEMPLVTAVWACHADADEETTLSTVQSLIPALPSAIEVHEDYTIELDGNEDVITRDGRITWMWDAEVEEALESMLTFLYFHQRLPAMPALKILGRPHAEEIPDDLLDNWVDGLSADDDDNDANNQT